METISAALRQKAQFSYTTNLRPTRHPWKLNSASRLAWTRYYQVLRKQPIVVLKAIDAELEKSAIADVRRNDARPNSVPQKLTQGFLVDNELTPKYSITFFISYSRAFFKGDVVEGGGVYITLCLISMQMEGRSWIARAFANVTSIRTLSFSDWMLSKLKPRSNGKSFRNSDAFILEKSCNRWTNLMFREEDSFLIYIDVNSEF